MDIRAQLDAVDRSATTADRDGRAMRVQSVAQTFAATIHDVWDALTSAERLPRWFLPVTGDLRLGGRYQLEGNASGTITSCDVPNAFSATWEFGGGISWVNVTLTAIDAGHTRLELEHLAPVSDVSDEMWDRIGPAATGIGWDQTLLGLSLHLTTGEVKPENAAEWLAGDEGLAFMRGSADRWGAVQAADGADPERAKAAADATYGMYTGAAPSPWK